MAVVVRSQKRFLILTYLLLFELVLKTLCSFIAVFQWCQSPRRDDKITTLCGRFLHTKNTVHFYGYLRDKALHLESIRVPVPSAWSCYTSPSDVCEDDTKTRRAE